MGTTRSGRYLNTAGSATKVSDYAMVHSDEGDFCWRQFHVNGKPAKQIRLKAGGHGQKGMELLDKYHIEYNVVKTYPNGVRVGNVPDHHKKLKREGTGQAWFPKEWSAEKIRKAGEHVAQLKRNLGSEDGKPMNGTYAGVRVGVILTNGKISTVFPDSDQSAVINRGGKK